MEMHWFCDFDHFMKSSVIDYQRFWGEENRIEPNIHDYELLVILFGWNMKNVSQCALNCLQISNVWGWARAYDYPNIFFHNIRQKQINGILYIYIYLFFIWSFLPLTRLIIQGHTKKRKRRHYTFVLFSKNTTAVWDGRNFRLHNTLTEQQ